MCLPADDGHVDWDEFTTFCIHTGLVGGASDGYGVSTLHSYAIEYVEDLDVTDKTLTNHASLTSLKHVPDLKRLLVTQEKDNGVFLFDEHFNQLSYLDAAEVQHGGKVDRKLPGQEPLKIMDIVYIPFKDLFCYAASDHTITFCKEHATVGRKRVQYSRQHRICHAYLQVKLCWSEHSKILCSVDAGIVWYIQQSRVESCSTAQHSIAQHNIHHSSGDIYLVNVLLLLSLVAFSFLVYLLIVCVL